MWVKQLYSYILSVHLYINSGGGVKPPTFLPVDPYCILKTFSCWTFRRGWISVSLRQIFANLSRNIKAASTAARSSLRGVYALYSCANTAARRYHITVGRLHHQLLQQPASCSITDVAPRRRRHPASSPERPKMPPRTGRPGPPLLNPGESTRTPPICHSQPRLPLRRDRDHEVGRVDRLLCARRPSSLLTRKKFTFGTRDCRHGSRSRGDAEDKSPLQNLE